MAAAWVASAPETTQEVHLCLRCALSVTEPMTATQIEVDPIDEDLCCEVCGAVVVPALEGDR